MNGTIRALGRRLRRSTRGQSLVEFALLTPLLMVFVVSVIDFGNMLFTYQVITNAAREGARRAAVFDETASDSVVRAQIVRSLSLVADEAQVQFVAPNEDGTCAPMSGGSAGYVLVYGCGWSGARNTDAVVGIQTDYRTVLLGRFLGNEGGTFPLKTRMVYRNE
ncbi:MAG: TadE/TadG family type IV pilus assembly protein [Gemmatimonadota bacterium]